MRSDKLSYLVLLVGFGVIFFVLSIFTGCAPKGDAGASGAAGKAGIDGTNGTNGRDGINGSNGTNGTNGINGSNGTTVVPVQFCPNVAPSYPRTFPEIGICIAHQLYGVYSANGGFMVLLPPGRYSSDGINASCVFTVLADCVVHQ
jgi:hypothetical protein